MLRNRVRNLFSTICIVVNDIVVEPVDVGVVAEEILCSLYYVQS